MMYLNSTYLYNFELNRTEYKELIFLLLINALFILVAMSFLAGLHKFKGTKLRTRMKFVIGGVFIFILLFCQIIEDLHQIEKGFKYGLIFTVPIYIYRKRWLEKRIEGTTVFYKKKARLRNFIELVIYGMVLILLYSIDWIGQIVVDNIWLTLGFSISYLISEIFALFYVVKMEKKLNESILEDQK